MQSETSKPSYLAHTFKSPQAKPFIQPNLNVSRPSRPAARNRKNERQQLLYYLEEIIDIQEMLYSLCISNPYSEIRQDFEFGLRGAPQLSPSEFYILTTFYGLITSPNHPKTVFDFILNAPHDANYKAAEHFRWLMQGRKILAEGTNVSYFDAKTLISRILRSGYFSQIRFKNAKIKSEIMFNDFETGLKQPGQTSKSPSTTNSEGIHFMANINAQLKETNGII